MVVKFCHYRKTSKIVIYLLNVQITVNEPDTKQKLSLVPEIDLENCSLLFISKTVIAK